MVAVYIILGILYESYVLPLTILSTLPSAGVGALLMLMIFGYQLTVIALIGIILLIGIVKKNGIMMVDFAITAERRDGMTPLEAIRQACLLRFRPILMTTMAAMLSGLPLMLESGAGSELRKPLGFAMVGGLAAEPGADAVYDAGDLPLSRSAAALAGAGSPVGAAASGGEDGGGGGGLTGAGGGSECGRRLLQPGLGVGGIHAAWAVLTRRGQIDALMDAQRLQDRRRRSRQPRTLLPARHSLSRDGPAAGHDWHGSMPTDFDPAVSWQTPRARGVSDDPGCNGTGVSASTSALSVALKRICSSRLAISRGLVGRRSDVVGVTCTISRWAALEASASGMSGGLAA